MERLCYNGYSDFQKPTNSISLGTWCNEIELRSADNGMCQNQEHFLVMMNNLKETFNYI